MSPLVGCDAAVFCVAGVALTALGWARWRHNSFHATLSHTDLSHSTLSHTSLSRTQLFHTRLCYLQLSLTHLLRTIFANSDVECILLATTLQLHLTGMGRWKDPRKDREETIAKVNARRNKLTDCDNSAENCPHTYRALSRNLSSTISFILPAFPINFHISVVLIGRSWHVRVPVFFTLVPKPL